MIEIKIVPIITIIVTIFLTSPFVSPFVSVNQKIVSVYIYIYIYLIPFGGQINCILKGFRKLFFFLVGGGHDLKHKLNF